MTKPQTSAQAHPVQRVVIRTKKHTFRGKILTSQQYPSAQNSAVPIWYVELEDDELGYIYWKQDLDGGTIEDE